jgi:RNA exonuclease NGL2
VPAGIWIFPYIFQSYDTLQEVDRLEKLLPVIETAGYSHHYASGPGKKHGCLIAFKRKQYSMHATKLVTYDDEDIRTDGDEQARRGCSFRTRNIGSILALKSNQLEDQGVVVATTHLFWHPKYVIKGPTEDELTYTWTIDIRTREQGQCSVRLFSCTRINDTDRQSGILVRETSLFRSEIGCDDWPGVIGGGMLIDMFNA